MVQAQWDLANENELGNQQLSTGRTWGHSGNAYVTVCIFESVCVCLGQCLYVLVCIQTLQPCLYTTHESLGLCESPRAC